MENPRCAAGEFRASNVGCRGILAAVFNGERNMKVSDNKLILGESSAEDLCARFGTPLYVYEEERIRSQAARLMASFTHQPFRIHYAVKANGNPQIVRILEEEGCGADAVSTFEVRLCLEVGMEPEEIIFTGDNATDAEMEYCLEKGVMINVGSLSQLERLGRMRPGAEVSVRINPDVGAGHHDHCITGGPDSKFGIYHDRLPQVKEIAGRHGLRIKGVHTHIGSGILDVSRFMEAAEVTLSVAGSVEGLDFVDFGGGLGIPYRDGDSPLDVERLGRSLCGRFKEFCRGYGRSLELKIEPGRFLVAQSGTLLARVVAVKDTPAHRFAGCDTGFNHLIRPMAYGSFHRIVNASRVKGPEEKVVVCGNLCESGDVFTRGEGGIEDRMLSAPKEGDVLALLDAGAYGMSMSMQYNLRPRTAEVLITRDQKAHLIRERESYEDLLRHCRRPQL